MKKESEKLIEKMEQGFYSDIPNEAKRRIIESSMEVFSKKGISAARISDIAQQAGFSQGFIYNHYKSKDDIFIEISNLASKGSIRLVQEADAIATSSSEKLYALAHALISPDTLAQLHFRLVILQSAASDTVPEASKESFKQAAIMQIGVTAKIIEDGQREGDIAKGSPIKMAMAYFAVIQGIALMRMQSDKNIDFPDVEKLLGFLKE